MRPGLRAQRNKKKEMNEEERKKSKAANEASGTNEANKANGTCGANGTGADRKPLEPQPFLPKKGNYRGLLVYQKAECVYDLTFYFAHHYFVERKDRTIDQMTAARLGYRNEQKARIVELEVENAALKARIAELEGLLAQKGGGR